MSGIWEETKEETQPISTEIKASWFDTLRYLIHNPIHAMFPSHFKPVFKVVWTR